MCRSRAKFLVYLRFGLFIVVFIFTLREECLTVLTRRIEQGVVLVMRESVALHLDGMVTSDLTPWAVLLVGEGEKYAVSAEDLLDLHQLLGQLKAAF